MRWDRSIIEEDYCINQGCGEQFFRAFDKAFKIPSIKLQSSDIEQSSKRSALNTELENRHREQDATLPKLDIHGTFSSSFHSRLTGEILFPSLSKLAEKRNAGRFAVHVPCLHPPTSKQIQNCFGKPPTLPSFEDTHHQFITVIGIQNRVPRWSLTKNSHCHHGIGKEKALPWHEDVGIVYPLPTLLPH